MLFEHIKLQTLMPGYKLANLNVHFQFTSGKCERCVHVYVNKKPILSTL